MEVGEGEIRRGYSFGFFVFREMGLRRSDLKSLGMKRY